MENRMDQLEYTVMELGTEIFRLKSQLSDMSEFQDKVSRTLKSLRDLIDEKGMITEDDFDSATHFLGDEGEEMEMEDGERPPQSKVDFH